MARKFLLMTLLAGLSLCVGCDVNPITGEDELMLFPEQQDVEIGRQYAPEVEKELGGRIEDEELQRYVDGVGQKVARISHRPGFPYMFVAVKHKMVNAVALPGGYIFITKGMLYKMTNEAQLAAVLAHETSHVVARDTANAMSNQIGMNILMVAASQAQTSQAAMTAADLARQIVGLKYSRDDERIADLAGMDYMVRAGYSPYGAVEVMQMLEKEQTIRPIEFLSSHPSPENRVGYMRQRIQTHYFANANELRVGKEDFSTQVLERLNK